MRKMMIITLLLIVIAACNPVIQENPAVTLNRENQTTPVANPTTTRESNVLDLTSVTPRPTSTQLILISTTTSLPTVTPLPTPVGLSSREELEQRIKDWIDGEIEFNDAERQVDEFGNALRLGVLYKISLVDAVSFIFYNLGFSLIKDQDGDLYLINIVGFEDGEGKRFTIVFSNGLLHDYEKIIHLSILQGRIIYQEKLVSADEYKPQEFAEVVKDLPNSVFGAHTSIGGVTGDDKWNYYLSPAKETTEALTDFLLCEECTVKDTPEILQPFINTIPEVLTPDTPFLYYYYVSYW